ncbi:MAG: PQQ-binding-like beta-propeller repeat protein, partial [Deltaproteobacteria bacterium]|nr:PQQ-binding-like beta-propeller repeat protein [Deltaproteobacteria bacterium]
MNENTVNISDETTAKDSLETLPGRPKGWYVCPNCAAEYDEPHHFCSRCNYYTPSWWHATDVAIKRSRWKLKLTIALLLFSFIGYMAYKCRVYIPNPFVLARSPVSNINSNSGPEEWTMFAANAGHTRFLPVGTPPQGRIRWKLPLGELTDSAPVVKDGMLYVGGFFKIHALDAATGKTIWEAETTGPVHSSPALAGNMLFLGLLDGRILALDSMTGALKWEYQTENFVFSSPTVVDGVMYIGSGDESIYAFDALTGKVIWRTNTMGRVQFAPTVVDNVVYAPTSHQNLYCAYASSGALKLRFRMHRDIQDSSVVANGMVYFVSRDGNLYTMYQGAREYPGQYKMLWMWAQFWLWKLPVPPPPPQPGAAWRIRAKNRWMGFTASPAVAPDAFYIGDRAGWFYGRDLDKGKPVWEFKAKLRIQASPLILGDNVYFGSEDGHL